jgi:serine/threonine-protein kinase RsbW
MSPSSPGVVELSVPADVSSLHLARLTASGFASPLGASIDTVEQIRLAVDEACALLVESAADGARLHLTYEVVDEAVVITVTASGPSAGLVTPHPVTAAVLASTADDYSVGVDDDGRNVIRLSKHLSPVASQPG